MIASPFASPFTSRFLTLSCLVAWILIHPRVQGATEAPWPQFRGPNASGVAAGAKPHLQISPDSGLLWKVDLPWSPSSPVVWGDRIFLNTFDHGELQTRAYSRKDGSLLWTAGVTPEALEEFHRTDGSPAASTPATDGKHVVSYFGSFGLICHDVEGKELWRHPMPVAKSAGKFGSGTSPIIMDQSVILSREDPGQSRLIALDLATGKPLWETPRPDIYGSFGTPIVWLHDGRKELVVPGSLLLKSYVPDTGKELWSVSGLSAFTCTTPVIGEGRIYYGSWSPGGADNPWPAWSEFRTGRDKDGDGVIALEEIDVAQRDFLRALDLNDDDRITEEDFTNLKRNSSRGKNTLIAVNPGGKGDITESHVAWSFKKGLPYVPSPLYYEGRLYLIKDGGLFTCLNPETGEPYYEQERLEAGGSYYASPVAADGRIYIASLPGKLSVMAAGGDTPKLLHRADFGERIFATPALVGDKLYLRTASRLYAFGDASP